MFGVEIDKDVVRRVLARHYRPEPGSRGPSWLTFLGHSKDSLWSVDLFRCESLILRSRSLQHVQPCNRWAIRHRQAQEREAKHQMPFMMVLCFGLGVAYVGLPGDSGDGPA